MQGMASSEVTLAEGDRGRMLCIWTQAPCALVPKIPPFGGCLCSCQSRIHMPGQGDQLGHKHLHPVRWSLAYTINPQMLAAPSDPLQQQECQQGK